MKTIIFSGFLGAGKTTLIKKLIKESFKGQKLVLIENEFGQIGVDSGFLKECDIQINEINSGCICCSLVGDFTKALQNVVEEYSPEILLIEPSGVGKLSDVIKAVSTSLPGEEMISVTVVDATKCKMYASNFGEFFKNQIQYADTVILSHTSKATEKQLTASQEIVRDLNGVATLITTDWDKLEGNKILETINGKNSVDELIAFLLKELEHCEHGNCSCGCGHHEHEHEDCCCSHHEHEHEEGCSCGCGHHEHEHHHAEEVFTSFGRETSNKYTKEELENLLESFDEMVVGMVLRAKGIVESEDGKWLHFDYTPGEIDVRYSTPEVIGKICVIGSNLDEEKISKLFRV